MLPFGEIVKGKAFDCGKVAPMSIVNGHIAAFRSAQHPAELAVALRATNVQMMYVAGKAAGISGATKPCFPSYYYSYRYL